uniref:CSON009464 protein n=1 Tax=Culicoides sonorensis TaxID=179676 RepID=A0A336M422_CULSO
MKRLVAVLSLILLCSSLSNSQAAQNQFFSTSNNNNNNNTDVSETASNATVPIKQNKNYVMSNEKIQNKSENDNNNKKLPGSIFVNNNYPKPISLWDSLSSKNNKKSDGIIDTKTAVNIPGFPTGDGEFDFNPDDLEALQDKLVDETLQGVSSLINNDNSDLNDDFDSFVFPESSTEPDLSSTTAGNNQDHIFRVPNKPKKFKKHDQNKTINAHLIKYDYKHFSNLHLFINLYDHHLWDSEKIRGNVTEQCGKDMKSYLTKLRGGSPLALRTSDVSGRYGGLYFFGNDFWMGSLDYCNEVNFLNQKQGTLDRLPKMGFFMAKILVRIDPYFAEAKLLQLGQCLPISCEIEDVYTILRLDPASQVLSQTSYKTGLNIFNIRRVPGGYQLKSDPKYFILVMVVSILVIITIVASIYESILLGKGYDLVERRRSSRVKKVDIDQIKKNGATDTGTKHMEMYRMGQENNNVDVSAIKNGKHLNMDNNHIEKSTRNLNIFSRFLICFGLRGNMSSICNVERSDADALTCVHGMRLFSLLWTIMVHTYLQLFAVGENRYSRKIAERTFTYQIVGNATFSVDTFFFISGVLIVYLYYKKSYSIEGVKQVRVHKFFKISAITVILLLLSSWVVAIFVSLHFKYIHKVADPFESFDILYDKPWQRMGPYIVGMITGYIIVRKRTAPKVSLLLNVFLWCLSFTILFALIFGVWKGELSVVATAFYVSMGHTAWGVALVWICLSCYWGLARPINNLLSYRGFYPLSRLTYCAYLIHPVIMVVTSFQTQGPISMTHSLIMTTFLGNAVLSFILALIISLLFEAPVIRLLKIVFRK